jgi:hypothetical protein
LHQAAERNLFVRERADGLYTPMTYLLSKMLDELVINFVVSIGISSYVFYGLSFTGSFMVFWLSYFVSLCNGIGKPYYPALLADPSLLQHCTCSCWCPNRCHSNCFSGSQGNSSKEVGAQLGMPEAQNLW